jgi:hypothetical protein
MSRSSLHVVQLRLTDDEWNHICAIARLRQLTLEELLREELRLTPRQPEPTVAARDRSHLRVVGSAFEVEPQAAS